MNTTDRNEFAKNKTMGEVMDLLAKKWDFMSDDEKEEVAAFLSDTRPRTKENREVSYRQIIDTIEKRWNEFEDWQKSGITELVHDLNHEKNMEITFVINKLTVEKVEPISHTFNTDYLREDDLLRSALLCIIMHEKCVEIDGVYQIDVFIDNNIDDQYLIVIEDRTVVKCTQLNEIDLNLHGGTIE